MKKKKSINTFKQHPESFEIKRLIRKILNLKKKKNSFKNELIFPLKKYYTRFLRERWLHKKKVVEEKSNCPSKINRFPTEIIYQFFWECIVYRQSSRQIIIHHEFFGRKSIVSVLYLILFLKSLTYCFFRYFEVYDRNRY